MNIHMSQQCVFTAHNHVLSCLKRSKASRSREEILLLLLHSTVETPIYSTASGSGVFVVLNGKRVDLGI